MKCKLSPYLVLLLSVAVYAGFWREVLLFSAAALLHEAGHLTALYALGVPIRSLHLGLRGAVLETGPCPRDRELLAAAAGPAVNLLCGLWLPKSWLFCQLHWLLLLYNLLPVYPLDGGRLLYCLLAGRLPADALDRVLFVLRIFNCGAAVFIACYLAFQRNFGLYPLIPAGFLVGNCLFLAKDQPP